MQLQTTRFGEIEVEETDIWTFPEGLLGFGTIRQYALLKHPGGGDFEWIQATQQPHLAFPLINPLLFLPSYQVAVRKIDLASIDLSELDQGDVKTIVVVRKFPTRVTANLQGPLVFNPEPRLAKQLVLLEGNYSTRHLIYEEGEKGQTG